MQQFLLLNLFVLVTWKVSRLDTLNFAVRGKRFVSDTYTEAHTAVFYNTLQLLFTENVVELALLDIGCMSRIVTDNSAKPCCVYQSTGLCSVCLQGLHCTSTNIGTSVAYIYTVAL